MIELSRIESYALGFIQTDGHCDRRHNYSIEISKRDEDILHKLKDGLNIDNSITRRTRDTNLLRTTKAFPYILLGIHLPKRLKV